MTSPTERDPPFIWIKQVRGIYGPKKAVMLALTFHADQAKYTCFPSIPTLAELSGLAQSTVQEALAELQEMDVIKRASAGPGKVTYTALNYRRTDWMDVPSPPKRRRNPPARRGGIETHPPGGVTHPPGGGDPPARRGGPTRQAEGKKQLRNNIRNTKSTAVREIGFPKPTEP